MRVIILSKAPVAGEVKTRLMPAYSADAAAELQALMTEAVVRKVLNVCKDVWLAVDDENHDFISELSAKFDIRVYNQGLGCLGERLTGLMIKSFEKSTDYLMFLGSDSPHVPESRYQDAFSKISEVDIVIGPVEDGGYDLIVLKEPYRDLFQGITWSSEFVLRQTLAICKTNELKVHLLDESFDLDRIQDLKRAPPESW